MPTRALLLCCALLPLLSPRFAVASSDLSTADFVPLNLALRQPPEAEALRKLPAYRGDLGNEEYVRQITDVLTTTDEPHVLHRCLVGLVYAQVNPASIPAPKKEPLIGFIGRYLYVDFKPENLWPHYPFQWHTGMKQCVLHALNDSDDYTRQFCAVQLLPTFVPEAEMATLERPKSFTMLAERTDSWYRGGRKNRQREALRRWQTARWNAMDDAGRKATLDRLFVNPLMRRDNYESREDYPTPFWQTQEDLIPLAAWLRERPEELDALLDPKRHRVSQHTLRFALFAGLFPLKDERALRLIVAGLKDDGLSWNNWEWPDKLRKSAPESLDAMRAGFRESKDAQQRLILADLMFELGDSTMYPEIAAWWYETLSYDEEVEEYVWALSRHAHNMLWRFRAIGEPGHAHIIKSLPKETDPLRAGLGTLMLWMNGQRHRIPWDDRLVQLLATGLRDNDRSYDLGVCSAALKAAPQKHIDTLMESAAISGDQQQIRAVSVLVEALEEDTDSYLEQYYLHFNDESDNGQHAYWEFSFFW